MMEINMRTDANTLAHFYAGFAGPVRVILDSEDGNANEPSTSQ
jgi:hypothetical protein